MTDWVQNSSAENSNQSQLNVANDDPSAYSSVPSTPMNTFFLVNSEVVNRGNVVFDNLTRDPRLLFQQKSCADGSSISMPLVTSGLNDTAFAPPTFESAQVNPRIIVEKCVSDPVLAMPVHIFPSSQPVMTVATATLQRFTAAIATNGSLLTQIFPSSSSCTKPLPLLLEQPITTSHALTIPDVGSNKIAEISKPVIPAESRGTNFYCNPSAQTALHFTRTMTNLLQQKPFSINAPPFVPTVGPTAPVAMAFLTVQGLAQLLAVFKEHHLPECKTV